MEQGSRTVKDQWCVTKIFLCAENWKIGGIYISKKSIVAQTS